MGLNFQIHTYPGVIAMHCYGNCIIPFHLGTGHLKMGCFAGAISATEAYFINDAMLVASRTNA